VSDLSPLKSRHNRINEEGWVRKFNLAMEICFQRPPFSICNLSKIVVIPH
jgi:hypothetical protein